MSANLPKSKIILNIVSVIAVATLLSYFFYVSKLDHITQCNNLDVAIAELLHKKSVLDKDLIKSSAYKKKIGRFTVRQFQKIYVTDYAFDAKEFEKELDKAATKMGFFLIYTQTQQKKDFIINTFFINLGKISVYNLTLKQPKRKKIKELVTSLKDLANIPGRGKVAIVIDDWGYSKNNIPIAMSINKSITLSILPNLPYSRLIAEQAKEKGMEVILHMPMEPNNANIQKEPDTIYVGMKTNQITELLEKSFKDVPYIKGINNHMGSKATEDIATMSVIFNWLKHEKLFFLDSVVTDKSICRQIAKSYRIKFAKRDVFLDNQQDQDSIRNQLYELALIAKKNGKAIGIGHDRTLTMQALRDSIKQLEAGGIEFVNLSELVE